MGIVIFISCRWRIARIDASAGTLNPAAVVGD